MLTASKLVEKLKSNFFLKKAQDEASRLGELRSQIMEIPEGEIIYQTGEKAGHVYLILYGLVKIKIKTKQGAKIINKAAGDFFGEREVLEGLERNSTAIAEIGTELLPVPASLFIGLVYNNKEIKTNVKINLARTYDLTKEGAEAILDEGEPETVEQLLSNNVEFIDEDEDLLVEEEEEEGSVEDLEEEEESAEELEEFTPLPETEITTPEPEFTYSIPDEEEEEYEEEFEEEVTSTPAAGHMPYTAPEEISTPEEEDRWDEEEDEFRDLIEEEEVSTLEEETFTPPQADHTIHSTPEEEVSTLHPKTSTLYTEVSTLEDEVFALDKEIENRIVKLLVSLCLADKPDDIYNALKDELPAMVGAREFVSFIFDGGFLTPSGDYRGNETNFAVREKIAYELITMKEPVTLFDLDGSGMIEGLENVDPKDIPASLLYYPLTDSGHRVIGCFIFFSSVSGRFSPRDVVLLADIVKATSGILEKITAGKTSLTAKYEDLQKYNAFFGSEIRMAVETILSVSETLDRGKLSDKVRFGFDIIRERASGLKGFLDSIQFFVGKISGFTKQPYLVSELLDDFLVKVSEPAKQREVTLLRKYQADMVMFFNRELFIHALTLITQNSFDAMPEGGKIYFSTSANESNILISIRDTGPGIHAEVRDKIFEPFFTFGKTGVGLGLPIANKIIKEHGGYIYLESSRNQGTEIIIALPV